VINRPISQEEERGEEEEKGRKRGAERGRKRRGSMQLSLTDNDGRTDRQTKFLYESQKKTSLRCIECLISRINFLKI